MGHFFLPLPAGVAAGFFPGRGFRDLYESHGALYSLFLELSLTY